MKRVLWICNIMLPVIAKELSLPYSNREGWLTGIFNQLIKEKEDRQLTLGVCFPMEEAVIQSLAGANTPQAENLKKGKSVMAEGVPCYAFFEDLSHPEHYDASMEGRFAEIFEDFKPDIIHIFGTEFPHALAAEKAFGRPERTLLGIQGLCNEIAKVYQAGLPDQVFRQVTFRDFVRKDSLRDQQEKFRKRGETEKEIIRLAGHITGRTRFDKEGTAKFHPDAVYHPMNETMRSSFYEGEWKRQECNAHSIFFGQGDYPLKGLHFMLEAFALLLETFPDAELCVAGNSITAHGSLKEKLKLSAYGKYLLKLIKKYGLSKKVHFLGKLTEEEMKQQFLKSGVFVCASVLENSPNTIGEAMLLGMPVVAAEVGGIPDMITDRKEGLLFPSGDVKSLALAIEKVFTDLGDDGTPFVEAMTKAAKIRAGKTHDGAANYERLLEIYEDMGEGQ